MQSLEVNKTCRTQRIIKRLRTFKNYNNIENILYTAIWKIIFLYTYEREKSSSCQEKIILTSNNALGQNAKFTIVTCKRIKQEYKNYLSQT